MNAIRRNNIGRVVFSFLVGTLFAAVTHNGLAATQDLPQTDGQQAILVETSTKTWMRRGRTLMDVKALVHNKLGSVDLEVVTDQKDPHHLALRVEYLETRGRQYSFDQFGTIITCDIRLTHDERGTLLHYTVRESSGDELQGTAPYLEAMQKFETNPYIYLLGDLVRGKALDGLDETGALIKGLERLVEMESYKPDPMNYPHTMSPLDSSYAAEARDNTIEEVGRLKDPRAVPILLELLDDSNRRTRRLAAEALGSIGSGESRTALERTARGDSDQNVRAAAEAALSNIPAGLTR